jgi:pectinesterase
MRIKKEIGICLLLITGTAGLLAQETGSLYAELEPSIGYVVAADGSGDFSTLQAAINAVPSNSPDRTVIFLKKGIYREKVEIPSSRPRLTLIGEDADSTVVVWDDYATKVVDGSELGTFNSQSVRIEASYFTAMNLTFENDARPEGTGSGQNVAVSCYGDRCIFLHCRFVSWQDTYYSGSIDRQYFKDCYIEGAVDYIFGQTTVLFDSCQIQTVRTGGYITAASTLEDCRFGYVFNHCNITAPPGINSVYLGRPWKPYARTVFFECQEHECVSPAGWHVWDGKEETCYYAEYNCTGPGADTTRRVDWSHQLTPSQSVDYTLDQIFSASSSPAFSSGWDPAVEEDSLWTAVRRHTIMFMDPGYTDARIAGLLVNGETLPGWDPDIHEYSIEIESDTAPMPDLSASAVNPLARVDISYPESMPGFSEIVVLAQDGATHSSYRVYFSVDSSYTDSSLDSIRVANRILEDFDPEVLEYDVVLPAGTTKYYGLTGYAHVKATRVQNIKPDALPGTGSVIVTAVDGQHSTTYILNISLATGLTQAKSRIPGLELISPSTDGRVRFRMEQGGLGTILSVWDIRGSLVHRENPGNLAPGRDIHTLDIFLDDGLYIVRAENNRGIFTGRLLVAR